MLQHPPLVGNKNPIHTAISWDLLRLHGCKQTGVIEEPSVEPFIPTWGFFGHQSGSLNWISSPCASGQAGTERQEGEGQKGMGSFQCYGNHVDRYLQAAGPVAVNKEGPLSRSRYCSFTGKIHTLRSSLVSYLTCLLCFAVTLFLRLRGRKSWWHVSFQHFEQIQWSTIKEKGRTQQLPQGSNPRAEAKQHRQLTL